MRKRKLISSDRNSKPCRIASIIWRNRPGAHRAAVTPREQTTNRPAITTGNADSRKASLRKPGNWAVLGCILAAATWLTACEDAGVWITADDADATKSERIAVDLRTMSAYDRTRKSGPICQKSKSCGVKHTNKRSVCTLDDSVRTALIAACAVRFSEDNAYCQDLRGAIGACP